MAGGMGSEGPRPWTQVKQQNSAAAWGSEVGVDEPAQAQRYMGSWENAKGNDMLLRLTPADTVNQVPTAVVGSINNGNAMYKRVSYKIDVTAPGRNEDRNQIVEYLFSGSHRHF